MQGIIPIVNQAIEENITYFRRHLLYRYGAQFFAKDIVRFIPIKVGYSRN